MIQQRQPDSTKAAGIYPAAFVLGAIYRVGLFADYPLRITIGGVSAFGQNSAHC